MTSIRRAGSGSPVPRSMGRCRARLAGALVRGRTRTGAGRPVEGGRGRTWGGRTARRVVITGILACRFDPLTGGSAIDVGWAGPPCRIGADRCTLARLRADRGGRLSRLECRNATPNRQAPIRRRLARGRALRRNLLPTPRQTRHRRTAPTRAPPGPAAPRGLCRLQRPGPWFPRGRVRDRGGRRGRQPHLGLRRPDSRRQFRDLRPLDDRVRGRAFRPGHRRCRSVGPIRINRHAPRRSRPIRRPCRQALTLPSAPSNG